MAAMSVTDQQRADIINNKKLLRGAHDESQRFSLDNISFSENMSGDYLKFNAYSMRDVILRKLAANPEFTGQVYPGSNISLLVDLVAYVYQTLVYQINHAASESMFSDTQYYENIVRLAKMLGYNAKGLIPATAMFRIEDASLYPHWRILPFSFVTIGERTYSYSPYVARQSLEIPSNITEGTPYDILLLNGKWKRYHKILTAAGSDYETFRLDIGSDIKNQKYATTNNIYAVEVIKEYKDTDKQEIDWSNTEINWYTPTTNGLFKREPKIFDSAYTTNSLIYSGSSTANNHFFNVELDSDKNLILTFGNGLETDKLTAGAEVYIFYLDTEGENSSITASDEVTEFKHNSAMFEISDELYANIFGIGTYDLGNDQITITGVNTTSILTPNTRKGSDSEKDVMVVRCASASSPCYSEEGVDDIRELAPQWFKLNNRLVTKSDYEFYLKTAPEFRSTLADVKVMNNWEYASTFYRWLNQLGLEHHNSAKYYLNSSRFVKYGNASLADPADNNNVYIWYISEFDNVSFNFNQLVVQFKSVVSNMRDLTQEPVFMPAIPVTCEISSVPTTVAKKLLTASRGRTTIGQMANGEINTWLEVRLQNNYAYTSIRDITSKIAMLLVQYFKPGNHKIGFGRFSTNDILSEVFASIPGISEIYTAYKPGIKENVVYTPGIQMNCWVNDTTLIDLGDAFWHGSQIMLEEFQYPVFWTDNTENISKYIKVVGRNSSSAIAI